MTRRAAPWLFLATALYCCSHGPDSSSDAGSNDGGSSDAGPSDAGGLDGSCAAAPGVQVLKRGEKISQLTGDFDRQLGAPTRSRTFTNAGLSGTDLGSSFAHDGRIFFLFGDSQPTGGTHPNPLCGDAVASTSQTDAGEAASLAISLVSKDGGFRSPAIAGVNLACFNVPLAGVSTGPSMYVWFSTNCMSKSVLAHSEDDGQSFTPVAGYALSDCGCSAPACVPGGGPPDDVCTGLSGCHFVNVSAQLASPELADQSPDAGSAILLFGSGQYRKSDVYLASTSLAAIEDQHRLQFYSGLNPATCKPQWSSVEANATPLFSTASDGRQQGACVGELSVHYLAALQAFVAFYNCDSAVYVRTAREAWGPWSDSQVLFDAQTDGYCKFIYQVDAGCPALSDPGRETVNGGDYGPYIIENYTQGIDGGASVYFVLSPWNPYNTMLMRAELSVTGP